MSEPVHIMQIYSRPFPAARKSRTLEEEDAFMACHGGAGARAIYLGVDAVGRALGALRRLARRPARAPQEAEAPASRVPAE